MLILRALFNCQKTDWAEHLEDRQTSRVTYVSLKSYARSEDTEDKLLRYGSNIIFVVRY